MGEVSLSDQIKKLRFSKKITMAVMAERIGVTTSAVAAYENGTRNPSFDVLIKIAKLFNVTIDNLLGYTNKDLIDVSGLSITQRDNVQNQILLYKKFNELVASTFETGEDTDLSDVEYYMSNSFERFVELLQKVEKHNFWLVNLQ